MLRLPSIVAAAALALALLQGADDDAAQDRKLLQGKWEVVAIVQGGKALPESKDGKLTFHFEGDKLIVKLGDKVMNEGTCRLRPSLTPKGLDLIDGKQREFVLGIYEVKADEAKLCMGPRGKERPKTFAADAGTDQSLVTLKRVK